MAMKLLYRHEEELWSQVYAACIANIWSEWAHNDDEELSILAAESADHAVERMRERMIGDE